MQLTAFRCFFTAPDFLDPPVDAGEDDRCDRAEMELALTIGSFLCREWLPLSGIIILSFAMM